jgi:hypothetical protein
VTITDVRSIHFAATNDCQNRFHESRPTGELRQTGRVLPGRVTGHREASHNQSAPSNVN